MGTCWGQKSLNCSGDFNELPGSAAKAQQGESLAYWRGWLAERMLGCAGMPQRQSNTPHSPMIFSYLWNKTRKRWKEMITAIL